MPDGWQIWPVVLRRPCLGAYVGVGEQARGGFRCMIPSISGHVRRRACERCMVGFENVVQYQLHTSLFPSHALAAGTQTPMPR